MKDYNNFDKIDYFQILFRQIERCAKTKTIGASDSFIESVELLEALMPFCEMNKHYKENIDSLKSNKLKIGGNLDSLPKKQRGEVKERQKQSEMAYYFGKFRALIRYADKKGLLMFKVVNDFED